MDNNILKAKEIFFKYGGSHYFMYREGDLENYEKYSISEAQEREWLEEYQNELLMKIENEKIPDVSLINLSRTISESRSNKYFKLLLDQVKRKKDTLDTFSRLRMCEELLSIVEDFKGTHDAEKIITIKEAKHLALSILKESIQRPVTVDPYYYTLHFQPDTLTTDSILSRIKADIKEWK
jgi:hypothetical protein